MSKGKAGPGRASLSGESAALLWTAEGCLETLDKLITEENYLQEQIFNMDETLFCVKGLLSSKEVESTPGCRAFKDRITALLGAVPQVPD